jgi:opacity protein-like surface antigen
MWRGAGCGLPAAASDCDAHILAVCGRIAGVALRRALLGGFVVASALSVALCDGAQAAKKHAKLLAAKSPPLPPAVHNWSGFYAGINGGIAWGSFNPVTSTIVDGVIGSLTAPLVNAAGRQNAGPFGFGGGIEGGYNWQSGNWLAGIEGDIDYLHLNFPAQTYVPFAPPNTNVVNINSYNNANWIASLRPRVGWTAGDWLVFVTGGLAVTKYDDEFSVDVVTRFGGDPLFQSAELKTLRFGYAVGGGFERAIGDNWSVKAEYLHFGFGRSTATLLQSSAPSQVVTQSAELNADMVRLGLKYRLGGGDATATGPPRLFDSAQGVLAPSVWSASDWEFDAGTRAFFSNGLDGESNPLLNSPNIVTSRLLYSNLTSLAGETYARVDHASGWFVKGYMGAGGIFNGSLHDEDFPAGPVYSNTYAKISGSLAYVTADAGYTFLKAPGAKLGVFAGYNFFTEQMLWHGCGQVAGSDICFPADPSNTLEGSNEIHFNSLRIGLAAEFMLTDRLKFVADAAYVPLVNAVGLDDHNALASHFPESASGGYGTMMEAFFTYNVTDHWNVGAGGRYWAWNMRPATDELISGTFGSPPPSPIPDRFNTDRYGVFVQSGYHWGDTTRPAGSMDTLAARQPPMNWSGVYLGGHLGGAWSDAMWSDPFGPTSSGGFENVPGFGDRTQAHGPLGGGQVGTDWQTGQWVFGVAADADYATIRGDNTCFSGLGGINCEHVVNALATLTGRVGLAWDRALFYVKGGGALGQTTYRLNGNTFALTLGTGSTTLNTFGWTVGVGLEYAITDHWTTSFEYDHIGLGDVTVPFPSVATIAGQRIGVTQWVDTLKLGVNYRFNWLEPMVAAN